MEADNLFASQEAEEEAKKESVKTFVPGEITSTPEVSTEEQTPKVVAPTPEQIIAIKVSGSICPFSPFPFCFSLLFPLCFIF